MHGYVLNNKKTIDFLLYRKHTVSSLKRRIS